MVVTRVALVPDTADTNLRHLHLLLGQSCSIEHCCAGFESAVSWRKRSFVSRLPLAFGATIRDGLGKETRVFVEGCGRWIAARNTVTDEEGGPVQASTQSGSALRPGDGNELWREHRESEQLTSPPCSALFAAEEKVAERERDSNLSYA
jgi:hypothetical protein